MTSPLWSKHFALRHSLPGKVFDSPASQLFRLERSCDRMLPLMGPSSRPFFARHARSGFGACQGTLTAHVLWMEDEGAATRDSLVTRGLGMNRGLGRVGRTMAMRSLRAELNRLNSVISLFRR